MYLLFYRAIGILPLKGREWQFPVSRLLAVYFLLSTGMHCSMFLGYGINHLREGRLELDYVCETVPLIGLASKHLLLLLRRSECLELLRDCGIIWEGCTSSEHSTVLGFEARLRKLFNSLLATCLLLNLFYSLTALSMSADGERLLPYRWYVDRVTDSPAYEAVFAFQVLLLNNAGIITMAIETVAPFFIMMSCGYMKVLQDRLAGLARRERGEEGEEELLACAKFHQSVLGLCLKIKRLTRTLFLIQLLCTAYNLSLVGIKLAGTDPDRYKFVSTFVLCLVQLFICQWTPDYLLQESEAVATAAYFASLSGLNLRSGRILLMMMQRAQRPEEITAGGMVRLSLETFGSMITSAVSFFAVLRSFNP